jgi:hypothetical protein
VLEGELDAINDDIAAEVAAHHVYRNAHKAKERRGVDSTSALHISPLRRGFNRQHLASLVEAAGRANPMWNIRSGALRARAQLGQTQDAVVGTPLSLPTARGFTFRDAHKM